MLSLFHHTISIIMGFTIYALNMFGHASKTAPINIYLFVPNTSAEYTSIWPAKYLARGHYCGTRGQDGGLLLWDSTWLVGHFDELISHVNKIPGSSSIELFMHRLPWHYPAAFRAFLFCITSTRLFCVLYNMPTMYAVYYPLRTGSIDILDVA